MKKKEIRRELAGRLVVWMEHTYSFFSSSADESDLDRALPSVRGTDAVMGARPPAVSTAACKDLRRPRCSAVSCQDFTVWVTA